MKKLTRQIILSIFLALGLFSLNVGYTQAALFQGSKGEACTAVRANVSGEERCDPAKLQESENKLTKTLKNIINILTIVVGIVSVIMIIVAGFRYITSAGDSNGITAARNTLIYAIVGLIIVAFAQIIVKFVLVRI
jgi:uncharacterized membrane protein